MLWRWGWEGGRRTSSGVKSGRMDDQENMVAMLKFHSLWVRGCRLLGSRSRQCRRITAIGKRLIQKTACREVCAQLEFRSSRWTFRSFSRQPWNGENILTAAPFVQYLVIDCKSWPNHRKGNRTFMEHALGTAAVVS